MTKHLLFFATANDLKLLIASIEQVISLEYIPMGPADGNVPPRYSTGMQIPNLGFASAASAVSTQEFLVVLKGQRVNGRRVRQEDRSIKYFIDQLENAGSVTFSPAGLWGSDVLLHGRIATVWDDETSQSLMKQFSKGLRKSFRKIKAFWVGPEAEALLDAGKRLTIAEQSSSDFDLKRP